MTINETKAVIDNIVTNGNGDHKLVVKIKGSGFGPSPAEPVKGIFEGFDWDSGRVIIYTESPLYPERH